MVQVADDLLCEVLKKVHADVSPTRGEMTEVKSELRAIRGHLLANQQDIGNIYASLGRHETRLDRIDRRLELAGGAH